MYKGRSESMQRGANRREREVMSKEEFYSGIKIVLTQAERAHFESGSNDKFAFLDRLEPTIRNFAKNGFRKPKDVARLLNKAGWTTACGAQWTPRLAWFLLGFLFDEKTKKERLAKARRVVSERDIRVPPPEAPRKAAPGSAITPAKRLSPPSQGARAPLNAEEIARRLAVVRRVQGTSKGE